MSDQPPFPGRPAAEPYSLTVTIRKEGNVIREVKLVAAVLKVDHTFQQDGEQIIAGQFAGRPVPDPFDGTPKGLPS